MPTSLNTMGSCYDRTVGYSPLARVDPVRQARVVAINTRIIQGFWRSQAPARVLVAGAGLGLEALHVQEAFGLPTVGVDLFISSATLQNAPASLLNLQRQDLRWLAFRDNSFGLVYCYHVLEHVESPAEVLRELGRVLAPGGVLFAGFPNRRRLLAYLGTSQRASWLEKLQWNIKDYADRIGGRFENRLGAHAGFTEREFVVMASHAFRKIHPVRNAYQLLKYPGLRVAIELLIRTGLGEVFFPSNYFVCVK